MNYSLFTEHLAALDIFVAERVDLFFFRAMGPVPNFSSRLCRRVEAEEGSVLGFEGSPFLTHSFAEAECYCTDSSRLPCRIQTVKNTVKLFPKRGGTFEKEMAK
jgi:hypothetical protein